MIPSAITTQIDELEKAVTAFRKMRMFRTAQAVYQAVLVARGEAPEAALDVEVIDVIETGER